MLVLSRKNGESVVIGDNVLLVVNKCTRNQVKLMFFAPTDVHILRGELAPLVEILNVTDKDSHRGFIDEQQYTK